MMSEDKLIKLADMVSNLLYEDGNLTTLERFGYVDMNGNVTSVVFDDIALLHSEDLNLCNDCDFELICCNQCSKKGYENLELMLTLKLLESEIAGKIGHLSTLLCAVTKVKEELNNG